MDKTLGQIAWESVAGTIGDIGKPEWQWLSAEGKAVYESIAAAVAAAVKEEDARICDGLSTSGDGEEFAFAIRASIKEVK